MFSTIRPVVSSVSRSPPSGSVPSQSRSRAISASRTSSVTPRGHSAEASTRGCTPSRCRSSRASASCSSALRSAAGASMPTTSNGPSSRAYTPGRPWSLRSTRNGRRVRARAPSSPPASANSRSTASYCARGSSCASMSRPSSGASSRPAAVTSSSQAAPGRSAPAGGDQVADAEPARVGGQFGQPLRLLLGGLGGEQHQVRGPLGVLGRAGAAGEHAVLPRRTQRAAPAGRSRRP